MKSEALLNKVLKPNGNYPLTRLGRYNDGGYLIDGRQLGVCDTLISLGVNDDWSFERQFLALNDCPSFSYDGSVSSSVFMTRVLKSLARPWRLSKVFWCLQVLFDYQVFFTGTRRHIKKFVGFDDRENCIAMNDLFREHQGSNNIFLKIDIEGYEDKALIPFFHKAKKSLFPTNILIEHSGKQFWENDLIKFLLELGYKKVFKNKSNLALSLKR